MFGLETFRGARRGCARGRLCRVVRTFAFAAVNDPDEVHCGIQLAADADRMKQAWNLQQKLEFARC